MRATQVVGPGRVEFVEAPAPQPAPGYILVRPLLLSICGSDLGLIHHTPAERYPLAVGTAGHEVIAVVESTNVEPGAGPTPGTLVLALAEKANAMAELCTLSVGDALPLPDGAPLEHLLMAQQLGTVVYACKCLPNVLGKTAAVIGQGSAGLFFDALLRRLGAKRVIGIDLVEARVRAARKFGATDAVDGSGGDAVQQVQGILDGELPHLVIEAAGEEHSINLAVELVRRWGHLHFFGIPHAEEFPFTFMALFRKYCHTTSSGQSMLLDEGRNSFRMALELIATGAIDVAPMITHHFQFDDVLEAYALAQSRRDGVIKVVVDMPGYHGRV